MVFWHSSLALSWWGWGVVLLRVLTNIVLCIIQHLIEGLNIISFLGDGCIPYYKNPRFIFLTPSCLKDAIIWLWISFLIYFCFTFKYKISKNIILFSLLSFKVRFIFHGRYHQRFLRFIQCRLQFVLDLKCMMFFKSKLLTFYLNWGMSSDINNVP